MTTTFDVRDVEAAITDLVREGADPTLPRVARRLATTKRTLQRRVSELGRHFRDCVDAVRHRLACELLLAEDEPSVTAIAFKLGYADGRAFARAFRRWSGTVPSAYRARASGADADDEPFGALTGRPVVRLPRDVDRAGLRDLDEAGSERHRA